MRADYSNVATKEKYKTLLFPTVVSQKYFSDEEAHGHEGCGTYRLHSERILARSHGCRSLISHSVDTNQAVIMLDWS